MTKQEALKAMNEATNEMGRTSNYPELYAAAKAKHTEAKRALIELTALETVEEAEAELNEIVETVETRNNDIVRNAGVNTNATIAGLANGSISTQTTEETQRIYELKQLLMANTVYVQIAARRRILERRTNRK